MRPFTTRILICLIPCILAGIVTFIAIKKYSEGQGGFKLGVDLVGGTILVYEVEKLPTDTKTEPVDPVKLAEALKRRIDPADLFNITIRPIPGDPPRVEIILPTGSILQAQNAARVWQDLLTKVREKYDLGDGVIDVERGRDQDLVLYIRQKTEANAWTKLLENTKKEFPTVEAKDDELKKLAPWNTSGLIDILKSVKAPGKETNIEEKDARAFVEDPKHKAPKVDDIRSFVKEIYGPAGQRRDLSTDDVQRIKDLLGMVGSLEFRILANTKDDDQVIQATRSFYEGAASDPDRKKLIEAAALAGLPPPVPTPPEGQTFEVKNASNMPNYKPEYEWVELGRQSRAQLGLSNSFELAPSGLWAEMAKARAEGKTVLHDQLLMYSRPCVSTRLSEAERKTKKYEYFFLTRKSDSVKVGGEITINAQPGTDQQLKPCVEFTFNSIGGNRFYEMTSRNAPSTREEGFKRRLAVILDGYIETFPTLNQAIQDRGQISGSFTKKEVDKLVGVLRSGALPATLKRKPVSENTIGPTLGADTIRSGTISVVVAFMAVLAFMVVYYQFAGVVACVALFANLLLTIAFMAFTNAAFTLPGLAGLVLMLGMAVDANVLIYERLREERDRGLSLPQAIRNAYDRAFPTIIDTHLASIFTAVVLYIVGNDQLKGFGVSLTVGLVISLFTSLYMTRLMFDLALAYGLKNLGMFRLLSKTNINFMSVRHFFFGLTAALTLLGISIFALRGSAGLNVDFIGGTVYTGKLQLSQAKSMDELRAMIAADRQRELLQVNDVKELSQQEKKYAVTFRDGQVRTMTFVQPIAGSTEEERTADVKARLSELKDASVEQMFVSSEPPLDGGRSRYFTIRTTEKETTIVESNIDRLFKVDNRTILEKVNFSAARQPDGSYKLTMLDGDGQPTAISYGQVRKLFTEIGGPLVDVRKFGPPDNGQDEYKELTVVPTAPTLTPEQMASIFAKVKDAPPRYERLENFDSALAAETQSRAGFAILASWLAILLYLWFRFGNWTFGLAAVLCLIHDLCFTLGIIAACHWLAGVPFFGIPIATIGGWNIGLQIQDFKIDLPTVAALLTLVGYSVNDTIVVFDRIREVRGKNPALTAQMINDSVNQTLSRTILASATVFLVVGVLYFFGGEGVHLFAFVMVVGVVVGTYSSIYVASPLLLMFGEGKSPLRPALATAPASARE